MRSEMVWPLIFVLLMLFTVLVNGVANKSVGSEGCESPYHQLPGLDG